MILIVDMNCKKDSLGFDEFVLPLVTSVRQFDEYAVRHFSQVSKEDMRLSDKAVLSGTSLQDHETFDRVEDFEWVREWNKPVLGICAGMQTIGLVFEMKLYECVEIGMARISTLKLNPLFSSEFEVYELHNYSVSVSSDFEALAESGRCTQAFKHKNKEIYGVLFHPEVRNQDILRRFVVAKT